MRFLILILVTYTICGCTGAEDWLDEIDYCEGRKPFRRSIDMSSFFELYSWDLKCFGESISVECDHTFKIEEKNYEACQLYARAAVMYLNQNNKFKNGPINYENVTYSESGACIDTFISGNEGIDCYEFIKFEIPLNEISE